jgi:hypothetical protein
MKSKTIITLVVVLALVGIAYRLYTQRPKTVTSTGNTNTTNPSTDTGTPKGGTTVTLGIDVVREPTR